MMNINPNSSLKDKVTLKKALIVFVIIIVSFIFEKVHSRVLENIALVGAIYLAIRLKKTPKEVFQNVEWELIFFFIGLFILVRGVEQLNILEHVGTFAKVYSKKMKL